MKQFTVHWIQSLLKNCSHRFRHWNSTFTYFGDIKHKFSILGGRGDFLYELKNFKTENYDETELIRPWSICAIMPTSGSQGHYKLVAHTHRSVMAYSKIITPKTDFSSRAFLLNNPMGIASGLFSLTIATGIKRVLMDERSGSVEPRHMADYLCSLIWEEKCSIAEVHPFLVPFMAQKFDATEEPKKLYFLRLTGDKVCTELATSSNCVYS